MNNAIGFYMVTYDTEMGEAYYEGDKAQTFTDFIAEADKAGLAMGLIDKGDSILDVDYEISMDEE